MEGYRAGGASWVPKLMTTRQIYPKSIRRRTHERGVGLIETLVTMIVVAIVAALVVPAAMSSLRTYQRSGAARTILAEIRQAQQLAVTRRGVYGLQWGADPTVHYPLSQYRIVRDTTGSCGIPSKTAVEDGTDVIQGWQDMTSEFAGTQIASIKDNSGNSLGGVMFDSRGMAVNTCGPISFPV